jgi:hypothetical protein
LRHAFNAPSLSVTKTNVPSLAEIDENIVRNNPSPADHALLTARRFEIIKQLAEREGTL